jgi:hypothetical protein
MWIFSPKPVPTIATPIACCSMEELGDDDMDLPQKPNGEGILVKFTLFSLNCHKDYQYQQE